jgi:hypothetical protein
MFRRECYEDIGGYLPIPLGGEDAAAEVMARMRGWEVRSFPDLIVHGHRKVSMGRSSDIRIKFDLGRMDYSLGYHPLFQAGRCVLRMKERPYAVGSLARYLGYLWGGLGGEARALPGEVMAYLRKEQLGRMLSVFFEKTARMEIMSLLSSDRYHGDCPGPGGRDGRPCSGPPDDGDGPGPCGGQSEERVISFGSSQEKGPDGRDREAESESEPRSRHRRAGLA